MNILFNEKTLLHNSGSEIEGPYRISSLFGSLKETLPKFDGEKFLTLVHSKEYIDKIKESCINERNIAEINLSPESYEAAIISIALSVQAALEGDFAAIRPPGHHASKNISEGFCLFNNIAIAVQNLVNEGKRIAILDFDGHHGNGTQDIFYDTNKVLYCSIHQQHTYPGTGHIVDTGEGLGKGYTINLPLSEGSDDGILIKSVKQLLRYIKKFDPDIIAVSAGFDGHYLDKLLSLRFSEKGYYEVGRLLKNTRKKIFAVLEGGYHEKVVDCIKYFVEGVNGVELFEKDLVFSESTSDVKLIFEENLAMLKEIHGNA